MIRKQETRTRLLRIIIDSGAWIFTGWGGVKSLRGFASGTAAPSSVDFREFHRAGVQGRQTVRKMYMPDAAGKEQFSLRNRRKSGNNAGARPRNAHRSRRLKRQ